MYKEYLMKCKICPHECNINRNENQIGRCKSKDTIKISDDNNIVTATTERKNTWIVQTPQCFRREILLKAHEKFKNNQTITDDCMLIELLGKQVKLIEGDYTNIKITTPDDINLIKEFLKKST